MRSLAIGRRVRKQAESFELREAQSPYKAFFEYRGVSLARSPIPDSVVQPQVASLSSYNGLFGVENDDIGGKTPISGTLTEYNQ